MNNSEILNRPDSIMSTKIIVVLTGILGLIFGVINLYWSIQSDMWLAQVAGAINKTPNGWTEYNALPWQLGSLLGPAMCLGIVAVFLVAFVSGVIPALCIIESALRKKIYFGKLYWMLIATLALWVLRVPMPGHWTLYYHFAVRY